MKIPPKDSTNIGCVMSNFDHTIRGDVLDQLKEGYVADYPGWDFHGTVWKEGDTFYCMVMVYHKHIETFEAKSIEEIMTHCCETYGYD